MNKVFDKVVEELEMEMKASSGYSAERVSAFSRAIEIVKQEAEKYNNAIIDEKYCFQSCACTEKCDKCSRLCNGDIDWYENIDNWTEEYNNGWIPVEEELPKDGDNRYYMCIVENHEEDPPMYCQYDEECGFGFYQDIYDEHTLGFVDCVFQTNEELGYEKVIAWQQLLPYQPKGE